MTGIENLEEKRPKPPATLYKYVHPDRVDVLQNAEIRFTPPLNTNDIFEVRQTFEMLAGPKFQELFREQAESVDIDQQLMEPSKGTMPPLMRFAYSPASKGASPWLMLKPATARSCM